LFESTAILYYLAEKSGHLLPKMIEHRSKVIKWLSFEAANMCPAMIELHHYIMNDDGDVPDIIFQRYKDKLVQYSSILDQQLSDRDYLADEYSIADIALFPWTAALEDMAEISLSDYPNLERWATRINLRYNRQQTPASELAFSNWCYQDGNVAVCSAG
ncbi:MAG: glutathione binding-like protein, partial [Gammaproteobacteria bacterium]|nr:glutathione binding-like protein [Gammaproteobacteria bacterium]